MKNILDSLNSDCSRAPRVLLTDTTRWALGARLAMSLAEAGCSVFALCSRGVHPLRKTRAVQRNFSYQPLNPLASLTDAISEVDPEFVIPCDDRAVQHLHELYRLAVARGDSGTKIAALLERSLGSPDSYETVSARHHLLQIAREEGLHVPRGVQINSRGELRSKLSDESFPWVLKADGTWGGGGVKIVRDLADAETAYADLNKIFLPWRAFKRLLVNRDGFLLRPSWRRAQPVVSAQSYIHGRPANCAVFCSEGKVLAGIAVEVVRSHGATGPATIVQVIDDSVMLRAAERLARRLKLSGFFGLDFVIEEGSGVAYLIEMNPRCTPLCHLRLGDGKDMPAALWAHLTGRPMRETQLLTETDRIAYFPDSAIANEDSGTAYLDIPTGEPELMKELLNPWPDRTLLYRAFSFLHALKKTADSQITFETSALSKNPHGSLPVRKPVGRANS